MRGPYRVKQLSSNRWARAFALELDPECHSKALFSLFQGAPVEARGYVFPQSEPDLWAAGPRPQWLADVSGD